MSTEAGARVSGSSLSHLECTQCGDVFEADRVLGLCPGCGKILYARYDLERVRSTLTREALALRPATMWRYHEVLPVRDPANVVSLGEGMTPLLNAPRLAAKYGLRTLLMKDEGQNPTGTFKARGLSAAISRALELGVRTVAIPTAGNAGAAVAAYAARGSLTAYVVMPEDTPAANKAECVIYGARTYELRGLINDAGRIVGSAATRHRWFDVSTFKEPYRAEGKKTMGYEIAEQLGWSLPDVIVYPTGGGTGLVGLWKAFDEMEQLRWIGSSRPRMVAVQSSGCAPIVEAFRAGQTEARVPATPHTIAPGLRVPKPIADYLILRTIRESGGTAVDVSDAEIISALRELASHEGVFASPEAAATLAGLRKLRETGEVGVRDRILLLLTGAGMKWVDKFEVTLPALDLDDPEAGLQRASVISMKGDLRDGRG